MQSVNGLVVVALVFASLSVSATQARPAAEDPSVAERSRLLAEFTDCVAAQKSRQSAIQTFLRAIPRQPSFDAAAMKAADLSCLNKAAARTHSRIEMRLQPETFRAALYPSLYRREFGNSGPVAGLSALPPLRLSDEFDGDVASLPADFVAARLFGDCVARDNPGGAHTLLIAQPTGAEESAAIEKLKPAFTACIKQGQTVSLTRSAIRASVGEAMVKLSRAAATR
ncbi:hypothetical protein [uncultured Sphingomonas sp.]|uniref:hypothetical protein n=1 Tax=uncultured Sphingomonas sp. TaxID=158754 RepID=UPI0025D7250E|nr:hypothetical protein [uncultured Sphingomonas sp.]